ncbi:myosin-binding protein C, slow-type [Sarotherodon galilaeus]
MDSNSEIPRYKLLKNSLKILDVRNNIVLHNITQDRSVIFPCTGTFRLSDLNRNDSGNYTLQTFDSDGRSTGEQTLQLFIQAHVSSVLLLSECLSQGEMRVSCFSEGGDSHQYSWTLDGRTLTDAELLSGAVLSWTLDGCTLTDAELLSGNNESNIITLKQHVSGSLVCSVRNNVSNVFKEERISTCDKSLLMCGLRGVVVILLLIGIYIYFAWRKKKHDKAEVSAVPRTRGDPEDSVLMVEMSSATYANT